MTSSSRLWRGSFRHGLVLVLLLATVVLASVLAWQALDAERSHRVTAEGVLRDYAALAAEQLAARCQRLIGFEGIYRVLLPLRDGKPVEEAPPSFSAEAEEGLQLSRLHYFRIGADGRLEATSAGAKILTPELVDELLGHARTYRAGWYWAVMLPEPQDLALAYARRSGGRLDGVVLDRQELAAGFEKALAQGPLLPATLAGEAFDNSQISITAVDPRRRPLFKTHATAYAYAGSDSITIASDLPEGLADLSVILTLRPEAASQLIIGGLPRSRLPVLVLLLLLTTSLVGVAVYQLRRERDLGRRQADFVAGVSHEFRTPLAQIKMFAETLLLKRVRSEEEEQRALQIIDQEVLRLSHLVENVMLFSRSLRRHVRVVCRDLPLAPLLDEMAERFPALAGSSGSRLQLDIDRRLAVTADEDALRQVLLNLLDNAVKYGAARQTVWLAAAAAGRRVHLSVEDEGEGISGADRDRIWKRFERLPRHRNSGVAGTGVGLAVVRELVEAMQGRVQVETGRHGARFVVELPRSPDVEGGPAA